MSGPIDREARIVGLRGFQPPTLEAVDRRRFQLWLVTLFLFGAVALALVILTALWSLTPLSSISPRLMQGGFLGLVALFCSYAIEKEIHLRRLAALLIEERVLTVALTNRLREAEAILEAARTINLDLDLGEVLSTILRCAVELLGGRDASFMLARDDRELRTVACWGESGAEGACVAFGDGIAGRVALAREPLLVSDAVAKGGDGRTSDHHRPASSMCVPLIHRDALLGVLSVNADPSRAFTEHDLRALSLFGEHAAAAIANSKLYEEQRLSASQSSFQALHDPLTGLPNRTLFLSRASGGLGRRGTAGVRAAIVFLDLDDFKRINDSLGHTAGDEALRLTADRLRAAVRASDVVARFGGDEFAIFLGSLPSAAEAVFAAERVRDAFLVPFSLHGRQIHLGATLGIALEGTGGATAEDMLRAADIALHAARARGKGGLAVFAEAMRDDIVERLDLESDLSAALERGELTVFYQPIFGLEDGDTVGLEALLRWRHPRRGLLAAASFVPFAEERGLLAAIDLWTLGEACRTLAALPYRRPCGRPLAVHVNLLPTRFQDPSIVDRVAEALAETGIEADRLVLEITENAVVSDVGAAAERLQALRTLGVRLSLDDFGTGYSSLSYLREFPLTGVKIDRVFIESLSDRGPQAALVEAIVRLGSALSLDVVAEGVETRAQADHLRRLGCPLGQGFYFARPLPYTELVRFLDSGEGAQRLG